MDFGYRTVTQMGLLSQQYPPPLLPKPGKDNIKLQKLLKRTAKKKASAQVSQSASYFRTSLSPVNEASPDLEHSDHSTPPKTPETLFSLYSSQHPPRFTVRPLYQHVASPYPQRAAYSRAARFSPQTVSMPLSSYSQHVTTVSSYSTHLTEVLPKWGSAAQLDVSKTSVPTCSAPEATVAAATLKKPAVSPLSETHAGFRPAAPETALRSKPTSPGPIPYATKGGQALIRPLTVLIPLIKPKSPHPSFKATEPSRSPRPMFDVPKIRMYTASTSYYETSKIPPVNDSTGLTAIGSTPSQSKTPTDAKQSLTPSPLLASDPQRKSQTSESRRGTTPTAEINTVTSKTPEIKRISTTPEIKRITPTPEIKRVTPTPEIKRIPPTPEIKRITPTPEIKRVTPTPEIKRITPTPEIKRITPTPEIKRITPTPEIKRITPTPEIKRITPTPEIKRITPTPEIKRITPTPEIKRITPTPEINRVTPTPEIKRVTPTPELQALGHSTGRPKTPAYHIGRGATPVFEISRPNPLLFAVSPIIEEAERSRAAKLGEVRSFSAPQSVKTTDPVEAVLNGDIHLVMTPPAKAIKHNVIQLEAAFTRENTQRPLAEPQTFNQTPTPEPATLEVTSHGHQRPKTPTYEASRLMTTSPGYRRSKTPMYATPSKTPTQVTQTLKSGYRGLTPVEYAAHGGIKTYSPAFGFSTSTRQTEEEVNPLTEKSAESPTLSQQPSMNVQPIAEVLKVKEPQNDMDKPHLKDEKVAACRSVPAIVVSQVHNNSGTILKPETGAVSNPAAAKQDKMACQEKAEVEDGAPEKVETPVQKVTKGSPEVKHPLPTADDQDALKAVRKLSGKDKIQKSATETKAVISEQKELTRPLSPAKDKDKGSRPGIAKPALPAADTESTRSEEKRQEKKSESTSAAPGEMEANGSFPAAELPLKVMQKSKGIKSKMSGWSRLKKHMVVEQEEPRFPETRSERDAPEQNQSGQVKADKKVTDKPADQDENASTAAPKATKMWDAVLFQMFSTKENIIHQIKLNKREEHEKEENEKEELKEIPSFAYRLPVLLFSPKFDAKKLKEAASRPVTKISTVFEMGLIGRKGKDEEPKDFNRKARGFAAT